MRSFINERRAWILIVSGIFLIVLQLTFPQRKSVETQIRNLTNKIWVIPIPQYITNLNPQTVGSALDKGLLSLQFSRLVKVDETLDLVPDVLDHWEYDPTNLRFTLTIRHDARFQNGEAIDAQDVVFSIHQWAKKSSLDSNLLLPIKGVPEYQSGEFQAIKGIRILNSNQLELYLSTGKDNFIYNLSLPRFVIFPKEFAGVSEQEFFKAPVGSGPFKLTSFSSDTMTFERNDDYFGSKSILKTIMLKQMPFDKALTQYRSKQLNNLIFYENSSHKLHSDQMIPENTVTIDIDSYDVEALVFNARAEPRFNDLALRRLVVEKIDRAKVMAKCYRSGRLSNSLIPNGIMGSLNSVRPFQPITSKVIAFGKTNILLRISTDQNSDCYQNILKASSELLNITVVSNSFNELFDLFTKNKLGLWIEAFVNKNEDPFAILQYFSSESSEYLLGAPYPELQMLFKKLDSVQTLEERSLIYRAIDEFLVSNYLVVPIGYHQSQVLIWPTITGLKFAGSRYNIVDWQNIGITE